jgi:hypothetical protein
MANLVSLEIKGITYTITDKAAQKALANKLEAPNVGQDGQVLVKTSNGTAWSTYVHDWARGVDKPTYKFSELADTPDLVIASDFAEAIDTIYDYINMVIPTEISQLNNDSKFITIADIPTKLSAFANDSGYITINDIPGVDLSNVYTKVETDTLLGAKANLIDGKVPMDQLPSGLSAFTNDTGYITINDIPKVDLSNIYTKTDIDPILAVKADLVDGKVPVDQLPSYVDDVLEGYYNDGNFYKEAALSSTYEPMQGVLYVDINSPKSEVYRWTGTQYIKVTAGTDLSELSTVAFTGSYNDLIDKPDIPNKLSQLANDSEYITISSVPTKLSQLANDSEYITLSSVPTKVSQLTNDSGYITINDIPTVDIDTTNIYTKEETDRLLSNKVDLVDGKVPSDNLPSYVDAVVTGYYKDNQFYTDDSYSTVVDANANTIYLDKNTSMSYRYADGLFVVINAGFNTEDFYSKGEVNTLLNSKIDKVELAKIATTGNYNDLENKPVIPTKVSQLDNDLGFITEVTEQGSLDVTAFEVLATDTEISAGTIDPYTGMSYSVNVPAGMTERFQIRSYTKIENIKTIVDWGDGSTTALSSFSGLTYDNDVLSTYTLTHTYQKPGRYIVTIKGSDYYNIWHYWGGTDEEHANMSLICRAFTADLPIASHINNFSNFFGYSLRHLSLDASARANVFASGCDLSGLCRNNTNLQEAKGLANINDVYSVNSIFVNCSNMTYTDFKVPLVIRTVQGFQTAFKDCGKLGITLKQLLGTHRWLTPALDMYGVFYGCLSIVGPVPSEVLWDNSLTTWTATEHAFEGSSVAIMAQVPTTWGGTNSDIIVPQYYEQRMRALESTEQLLDKALKELE